MIKSLNFPLPVVFGFIIWNNYFVMNVTIIGEVDEK